MSYKEFTLSEFNFLLTSGDQGLKEFDDSEKLYYQNQIEAFKSIVPNQPSFFISRESWLKLFQGISYNNDGSINNWTTKPRYTGFHICAFLICIGFHKGESKEDKPYFGYNPLTEPKKNQKAYIRVRTILKNEKRELIRIETKNIAYGDLDIALLSDSNDCLKFITDHDFRLNPKVKKLKAKIDKDIHQNPKGYPAVPEETSRIPAGFLSTISTLSFQQHPFVDITNNGNYFGSNRIWTDLLNTKYPKSLGTKISFMWDSTNKTIGQYFKINCDCVTSQPCPGPPGC